MANVAVMIYSAVEQHLPPADGFIHQRILTTLSNHTSHPNNQKQSKQEFSLFSVTERKLSSAKSSTVLNFVLFKFDRLEGREVEVPSEG